MFSFQDTFGPDTVHLIEEKVNQLIASRKPVTRLVFQDQLFFQCRFFTLEFSSIFLTIFREILDSSQGLAKYEVSDEFGSKKLITIPGECYPEENLSMIHTPISVEPCCGTHVLNTADIQVNMISKSNITIF